MKPRRGIRVNTNMFQHRLLCLFCLLSALCLCSCRGRNRTASSRAPAVSGQENAGLARSSSTEPKFDITDLGSLPGWTDSQAFAINNKGQVIGQVSRETSTLDLSKSTPTRHYITVRNDSRLFFYSQGKMRLLGKNFQGRALNDAGVIAGTLILPNGLSHAALWHDGRVNDLGTLGGKSAGANGINNQGQVIGTVGTMRGPQHAFLYSHGRMQDLGTSFTAIAIDDAGRILGFSHGQLCLRREDAIKPLGIKTKEFAILMPAALSHRGNVVYTTGDGFERGHAWLYVDGRVTDLGSLLPSVGSRATAVNDRGQVVGAIVAPGPGDWGALL